MASWRKQAHTFGTDVRGGLSSGHLRNVVRGPGVDTRYWCSHGIVCTLDPETGEPDAKSAMAIWNDSAGTDVDVLLMPLGQHVTCRYAGIQGGDVTVLAPIRPGDEVLVECPDGDLTTPVITKILRSRSARQPTDGGRPIFDNARMLIHARTVPIDMRTAGTDGAPTQYLAEQNGTVTQTAARINLGSADADQAFVLGTDYRAAENAMLDSMASGVSSLITVCLFGPFVVLLPGLFQLQEALAAFKAAAAARQDFLSQKVYGE